MKHANITLSFPSDIRKRLLVKTSNRGISKYVVAAVKKALDEDELRELQELEKAYEEAGKDPDRKKTIEEWEKIDHKDVSEEWE